MSEKPRINVTFEPEVYSQIRLLAHKEGKSMSELVRKWSEEQLNGTITKDNLDFICKIIREQLRDTMQPNVNRLAALCSKGCVQSSAATFLAAEAIARFVPADQQETVEEVYYQARKKAVKYTQNKSSLEDLLLD